MNIKVFVNIILVIMVLHLILKNINFNKIFHFGFNTNENFQTNEYDKTMEYLLDVHPPSSLFSSQSDNKKNNYNDNGNNTGCYKELVDYVNKCDDKNSNNVKAGNFYVEDDNSANFMSNVLNINKFYDIKQPRSYDGLNSEQLSNMNEKYNPEFLSKVEDQTCFPKRNQDNTISNKPDNWNYKNELPMNGGSVVGNVVGYDSLNTGYTMFDQNQKIVNTECSVGEDCNREPDDIRFGLGYPNREYQNTR